MTETEARSGQAEAPRAVECHGLRYRFGAQVAVDGIDVDVGTGEIFGLLGPNGAGKTTTVEILEGYRRRETATGERTRARSDNSSRAELLAVRAIPGTPNAAGLFD